MSPRLRASVKAAAIHMGGCLGVAALAAVLVFGVWFPRPYDSIEGGRDLFLLVVVVDAVCGPLLTLVLFNPAKNRSELARDLSLVVLIQVIALIYGLHSVGTARPVFLAFEADRFRIVSAAEITRADLPEAQPAFRQLSFRGPKIIAVHIPAPSDPEYLRSIELSLNGLEPALRPSLWQSYGEQRDLVKRKLQSLSNLKQKRPNEIAAIDAEVVKSSLPEAALGYLPIVGRSGSEWIALVARNNADVVGFVEVDGF